MKRMVMAVAVVLSIAGGISFAADNLNSEKDWCLLGISNKCPGTITIDLVDKIKRLNVAIDKGTPIYTPGELEHLKNMLEEANLTEELLLRRR